MATYLITGGAGFLGINLARHLLALGHRVVSLDLGPFDYPDAKDRVTAVTGDIRRPADLDRAFAAAPEGRVDVVVHAAAALPLYSKEDILTTDIDGTRNVLQAAERHHTPRVVHISSTAVYGIPDHHPLYEDDPLHGVGPYGEAKIAAEQLCLQWRGRDISDPSPAHSPSGASVPSGASSPAGSSTGLVVSILRPKSFVGPERLGVFALLYDFARTGHHFPIIGRGTNRYQLLDVADLCDAITLAAEAPPDVANDVYNVGAAEFRTLKEDFQAVLDEAGHGKRVVPLPVVTPMIWTFRALEAVRLSPLYKWVYETVAKDSFVSIEKAQRRLGFSPKYSTAEALLRNYRWYVDHLSQFEGASGVSHRVPWKQGALAAAKLVF